MRGINTFYRILMFVYILFIKFYMEKIESIKESGIIKT